ncbi:uncharacterized protein [Trachinotus anak]|uniref:uncharacterized protein isoform X2 n=1 Tax=Trachinotus anak TaxID=443729 RepID=UPI0039F22AD9
MLTPLECSIVHLPEGMLQHVTSPVFSTVRCWSNGDDKGGRQDDWICHRRRRLPCQKTCASSEVRLQRAIGRLNLVSRRHVVEVILGELQGRQVLQILSSKQQRRTTARDGSAREIHLEGYCLRGRHQKIDNDNTTGHT